jgi:hypothetical protein
LAKDASDVRKIMPELATVDRVKFYMEIMSQVAEEPSVAALLQDISMVMPENVLFLDMNIKRESIGSAEQPQDAVDIPAPGIDSLEDDSSAGVKKAPAEQLLAQQIVISLNCISKGSYSKVKARFDQTVEGLSSLFSLRDVDWDYSEAKGMGSFRCDLLPAGGRK